MSTATASPASARTVSGEGEFSVAGAWRYDASCCARWVASHVGRYRGFVVAFFSLALLSNIAFSFAAVLTGSIAEEMLKPGGGRLLEASLFLCAVLALSALCNLGASLSAENISKGFQADAREELYLSLLAKSQTFHGRQRVGDIMARATDDTQMLGLMIVPGSNLIIDSLLAIVVPCAFLGAFSPELLIVPGLFLVSHFIALRAYVRELGPVMMLQLSEFGLLNAALE